MPKPISLSKRFEAKFVRGEKNECWLWTASLSRKGYGSIRAPNTGRMIRAHRLAYEFAHGPIPEDMHVLHRCDVRHCVNPAHLFLGDHYDNMADMVKKRRYVVRSGEEHGMAKITKETVRKIRALAGALPQREIAKRYGLAQSQVWRILHHECWAD